eukprot:GHRR01018407.1.p1 GENE.GHRR01018407.1~~GHRR01018407.1.p1  ORF type:complete len:585 (+),score=188.77 GHRR01018407.1:338-2092(+)
MYVAVHQFKPWHLLFMLVRAFQRTHPLHKSFVSFAAETQSNEQADLHFSSVDVKTTGSSAWQQEQPQQQRAPSSFSWTKQWWPVGIIAEMDKKKPTAVTMLGHTYVVWFDFKAEQWRVMEDRCPHRLAPLSEGRIADDGTLACSYHGWQFNGRGTCTNIPQIGDSAKMHAACASPRACVASFPTTDSEGLLFAWLEAGPQAEAEAAAKRPYSMPEFKDTPEYSAPWFTTQAPVDYTYWLEQGMDPTHANFLHHTCGFLMSAALPMPYERIKGVTVNGGFVWKHGPYDISQEGMQAERQLIPPNALRVVYDRGFVRGFVTMGVPVRPGISRVFARFKVSGTPKKNMANKPNIFNLPHWARGQSPLPDQDTVVNVKQEALMREFNQGPRDYNLFSGADQGIIASHRWFEAAGYKDMWKQRMGPLADGSSGNGNSNGNGTAESSSSAATTAAGSASQSVGAQYAYKPYTPPTQDDIFSQYERHTKQCAVCQAGMKQTQRIADAVSVAALGFAVAAVAVTAAAKGAFGPFTVAGTVVLAGLAGACVWLRQQILLFRYTQFINSEYNWHRDGGLSLVKGNPIMLKLSHL